MEIEMPQSGELLKKRWMEHPSEDFQVWTLRELKVGDKFIEIPRPGLQLVSGFLDPYYIFQKTRRKKGSQNNVLRIFDCAKGHLRDSMEVIKVK